MARCPSGALAALLLALLRLAPGAAGERLSLRSVNSSADAAAKRLSLRGANSSAVLSNSTGFGVNSSAERYWRAPRVYFLFLAVDKVSNLDIWKAFFGSAPVDQYRAYVHCKLPACNTMVMGSPLVPVPTVPSYYCTDLVSPMMQLIAHALGSDGPEKNPADKFAFVSDSTLPAKPFSHVYATYTMRSGSDFCVFPSNEWADVPGTGGIEIAVKYHQWLTLERNHAEKASVLWAAGAWHDFMTRFGMNHNQYTWSNNTFADSRNFGCLDEFWHMIALYGPLKHPSAYQEQAIQLSQFTGSPLRVAATAGWQGGCGTFVLWSKYLYNGGNNPFLKLYSALDPLSVPHSGNQARPGWWDKLSTTGMTAIRNSDFLFVRKFTDKPRLVDGVDFAASYKQLVLTV